MPISTNYSHLILQFSILHTIISAINKKKKRKDGKSIKLELEDVGKITPNRVYSKL